MYSHESMFSIPIPVTSPSVNECETFRCSWCDDSTQCLKPADVCCFWFCKLVQMTQSQESAENHNNSVEHYVFGMTDLSTFPFAECLGTNIEKHTGKSCFSFLFTPTIVVL